MCLCRTLQHVVWCVVREGGGRWCVYNTYGLYLYSSLPDKGSYVIYIHGTFYQFIISMCCLVSLIAKPLHLSTPPLSYNTPLTVSRLPGLGWPIIHVPQDQSTLKFVFCFSMCFVWSLQLPLFVIQGLLCQWSAVACLRNWHNYY
jgi:hypothetical protein